MAGNALHQPVLRVMADAHPQETRGESGTVIHAVFAGDRDDMERGPFLGLVTEREIAQHPRRIFADLLTHRQPTPVMMDTLLDEVLRRMDKEGVDALPVFDASEIFVGAVTRTSLLAALLERERLLLDESQRRRSTTEGDLTSTLSLLTATLEATGDGILVVDTTDRITSFNRKFVEMWRIPEAVIASQDDNQALAFVLEQLEDPEAFLRKVRDLYAQPDMESFDVLTFQDGRVFERHSQPQRIGGVSVGRVWSFHDVTDRRQAEDALRESEQKFRELAENIKEVFWISDPHKNHMVYVSPGYEEIWGRTCESLYASPRSWLDAIHANDRDRVLQSALTKQIPGTYNEEYRVVRPDGSIRWINDRAFPVRNDAGAVYRVAGIAEDITERKTSSEALRIIVEGTASVIGEQFFRSLVRNLAAALQVRWAFISELADPEGTRVRLIGFWTGTEHGELFEYATKGTPCEHVVGKQSSYHPRGVRERFPEDAWLTEQGVEAYLAIPLVDSSGKALGHLGVMHDGPMNESVPAQSIMQIFATRAASELERTRAEDALRRSEVLTRSILMNAVDGIITIDDRGIVESFNPAAERIFGYPAAEVVGRNVNVLMPEPYHSEHDDYLLNYTRTGKGHIIGIGPREVVGRRKDGATFPMELSIGEMRLDQRRFFIGAVRDITERKQAQERLNHLAYHDVLTGLPNRLLFNDRFAQTAINASRHDRAVAVMFLDLDRFKTINDTLGHEVGDLLLKVVADRLVGCVREGDTVARLGGDEYAILLADMAQAQDAALVAQKILDGFAKPFQVGSHELYTTASIGITLFPTDDTHIENLLKNADAAMYRAKDRGRNNYQFYTADMNAKAVERLALETHLRHALERGELLLHYQPQVDLKTGHIIGTEALVRWQRPEAGLVSPLDFIPLAEETGLIVPIGEWVLRTACAQGKTWQSAGVTGVPVSVNVSARQFRHKAFTETVRAVLRDTGLRPDLLELEVTESLIMEHAETTIDRLGELHAMGVRLSIDDFGTGYSSLSYLTRFPIHTLKIDRAFINNVTTDPAHSAIASAIILLAHNLNLRVVAEGVETEAQAAFLRSHRCDAMQGYLFSRPVSEPDMSSMLARGRRWGPITPP